MARAATLAFERTQSAAGAVLALAALVGLAAANSRWSGAYEHLLGTPIPVRIGAWNQSLSLADWTRQGLMTVFFLVVGLQLKFEILRGEFSSARRLSAPLLAAAGGLIAPAAVYLAISRGRGGWPVVVPTDIATALAVVSLAGPRLPQSLRFFVLTIALADDVAGAGLAALSSLLSDGPLHVRSLTVAAVALVILAGLSRWRRAPRLLYVVGFVVVWGAALGAGLDPAIAGVACAVVTPIDPRRPDQESLLTTFLVGLHPYVAFAILPLFVFTAAGVPLSGRDVAALLTPVPLGILLALAIGKPLGAFVACAAGVGLRLARRPLDVQWGELLGAAFVCGAGFSVSLYVARPGFPADSQPAARLAILAGSLAAATIGWGLLSAAQARRAMASANLDL